MNTRPFRTPPRSARDRTGATHRATACVPPLISLHVPPAARSGAPALRARAHGRRRARSSVRVRLRANLLDASWFSGWALKTGSRGTADVAMNGDRPGRPVGRHHESAVINRPSSISRAPRPSFARRPSHSPAGRTAAHVRGRSRAASTPPPAPHRGLGEQVQAGALFRPAASIRLAARRARSRVLRDRVRPPHPALPPAPARRRSAEASSLRRTPSTLRRPCSEASTAPPARREATGATEIRRRTASNSRRETPGSWCLQRLTHRWPIFVTLGTPPNREEVDAASPATPGRCDKSVNT
ncbi:hypothetical protein DFR74_102301 [Nocardia puris]|uniref:Uncharacterized protein n=1 Tax=Nocardia puris TaxID=208602 RepID=A0A366DUV4_9NOCA|nr:hypothetical protein DFR74_102301 [Nocardia puris]